jgi:hypothetical protein
VRGIGIPGLLAACLTYGAAHILAGDGDREETQSESADGEGEGEARGQTASRGVKSARR